MDGSSNVFSFVQKASSVLSCILLGDGFDGKLDCFLTVSKWKPGYISKSSVKQLFCFLIS